MLRPARLPSPPGWLRRDKVRLHFIAPSEDIVTPASGAARYQTALGVRLDGRTRNLPSSGLAPDKSQQLVRLHDRRNKLHHGVPTNKSIGAGFSTSKRWPWRQLGFQNELKHSRQDRIGNHSEYVDLAPQSKGLCLESVARSKTDG